MKKIYKFMIINLVLIFIFSGCRHADIKNTSSTSGDSKDISSLKVLTNEVLESIYNRNYQTIIGNEEYKYYSEELQNNLLAQNTITTTKNDYISNKLVTQLNTVKIDNVTISGSTANVQAVADFTVVNCTDTYTKSVGAKKGNKYKAAIVLSFTKEKNKWKVCKITQGLKN